jgi:hypothetical protein
MFDDQAHRQVRSAVIAALRGVTTNPEWDWKDVAVAQYAAVASVLRELTRGKPYGVRRAAALLLQKLPDAAECPRAWGEYREAHLRAAAAAGLKGKF